MAKKSVEYRVKLQKNAIKINIFTDFIIIYYYEIVGKKIFFNNFDNNT